MTAAAEPGWSVRDTATRWRARVRAIHPVRVLRWLRAGALAMVLATALLYLLVSTQADDQLAAAQRTQAAIDNLGDAYHAAKTADTALNKASETGQVALIGTGTEFANATARVNTFITSAADGNADGGRGRAQFQFVQGQLTTSVQLADAAVRDYARSGRAGLDTARAALTARQERDPVTNKPVPGTGGLTESLTDLEDQQKDALGRQRHSHWLNPAYVWFLLVGPTAVMFACVLATGYFVARHFRRYVSPRLVAALLVTAAVGITAGLLCRYDAQGGHDPLVGHWLTRTLALSLLAAAGVLAYLGYRPRLAEYRFPRS
jgi:hypothetical protein